MIGAVWGEFLKSLHYLFNFTNFVITFQFISFYCVAKCVVLVKKVTSRISLEITYINWLRELDLNQRPSGYERKALMDFYNKINNFSLIELNPNYMN